ncbi:hypothetical protein [Sphingobium sp. KCTC 72723]|uniref:hypothetical protein n=1 Tax=Sphingobium sp. KCTC 72723 TaxID=2733867 RepID=UPI00165E1D6D|nr:hypothetical protein [Sphingobium sp. KCTC 72723]
MIALQEHPAIVRDDVAFDPGQWLTRYVELGGGYAMVGDTVWLHWLLNGAAEEAAILSHERIVRGDADRRNAVKALIMERVSREMVE